MSMTGDLETYGIDLPTLKTMYQLYCDGAKKSDLERRFLDKPESHGKLFTRLVRDHLGIETERRSSTSERVSELEREVARLRRRLRIHGLDPDGED